MNELRIYLNNLSLDEQRAFATKCGTTIGYLRKALSKNHELGAALCVLIEKASAGEVTRKHLHPSDWTAIATQQRLLRQLQSTELVAPPQVIQKHFPRC